ncbi:hypothetical protein E2C01_014063 [Portunus trituberculatus]|uniref:Uncharacterized protein n=1 Tax=Portunus trituberculatus TaxID=210409 RepID=A0A5B7DI75_PORTR|nr:hypothetical protein [Portunus trituberculatus]
MKTKLPHSQQLNCLASRRKEEQESNIQISLHCQKVKRRTAGGGKENKEQIKEQIYAFRYVPPQTKANRAEGEASGPLGGRKGKGWDKRTFNSSVRKDGKRGTREREGGERE